MGAAWSWSGSLLSSLSASPSRASTALRLDAKDALALCESGDLLLARETLRHRGLQLNLEPQVARDIMRMQRGEFPRQLVTALPGEKVALRCVGFVLYRLIAMALAVVVCRSVDKVGRPCFVQRSGRNAWSGAISRAVVPCCTISPAANCSCDTMGNCTWPTLKRTASISRRSPSASPEAQAAIWCDR